jgi:hypothetical protein
MRTMMRFPVPLLVVSLLCLSPALRGDPATPGAKQVEADGDHGTARPPDAETSPAPDGEEPGGEEITIEEIGPVTPAIPPVTPPAPAREALAVPAALDVRVTARHVVSEQIRLVPLEIRTPTSVRELTAVASLGEVHGPDRTEPGVFEAHVGLPALRGPAVVLVLFQADGYVGCARIPVWKAANLEVSTEPGAQVQVEIAGQLFGPVRATGRTATVPVEIPPGATTARVLARDAAGNETARTTPLPTGAYPLALVVPPAPSVLADDERTLPVLVAAADENGLVPREFSVETETGALGEPAEIEAGLRLYSWRPSRELGEQAFIVRQEDGETRSPVTMIAGPARELEIQAAPNLLPANGLSSSTIYAGVSDGLGHYLEAGPLTMDIAGGNLIAPPEQSGPVIVATVGAERMIAGSEPPAAIVVTARGGGYEAVVAIRQFDPDARGLRLTPEVARLTADGESRTNVRIDLLDGLGESLPVTGDAELAAPGSTVPATVALQEGGGTFTLQAGTQAGIVSIRASMQGAVAHASVTLDAGPPDHLRVELEPDGSGVVGAFRVRARLEDRFGNGVGGDALPPFVGRASRGELGAFTAAEVAGVEDVGWLTAPLTLPVDEKRGAEIEVQAAGWSGRGHVPGTGGAVAYVGVQSGYQHNLGDAGVIPLRVGIGWLDAFGLRGFLFGAELSYLGLRMSVSPAAGLTYPVTGDALTVHASLGYRGPVASWLVLIGELGLGMQVGWFRLADDHGETVAASDAAFAFSIGARLTFGFPVGPGLIALTLAYDDARFDNVVRGNVGGLGGLLGYRLEL